MKKPNKDYLLVLTCALLTPAGIYLLSLTPSWFHSLRFWITIIGLAIMTIIMLIVQLYLAAKRVA